MINPFKNITKKKFAGLLLIIIIIIAFGFGGFGGGFNTGNQNNIAKINNKNISTQDFMDYLNQSGLSQQVIKENIDKDIIEELLSTLISTTLLGLEIKELNLSMTEEVFCQAHQIICHVLVLLRGGRFGNVQERLYQAGLGKRLPHSRYSHLASQEYAVRGLPERRLQ